MASRLLEDAERKEAWAKNAYQYYCVGMTPPQQLGLLEVQDAKTHRLDLEEFSATVHKELNDLGSCKLPSAVAWCAVNELRAILVGKEIILPKPEEPPTYAAEYRMDKAAKEAGDETQP